MFEKMRVINIQPENAYSCANCGKEFVSEEILENCFWFCSNRCKCKFCYFVAQKFYPKLAKTELFALTKHFAEAI